MDKIEEYLAKCDERRKSHELAIAEILEEREKERELRRENLARMRDVDGAMARKAIAFQSAVSAQTKMDRESIHDMAQSNPTLLRILRRMGGRK